ncbi:MAG TPA: hypothetical protein VLZ81_13635, partial [Blastocatellia bacterium]|nr:hypothetical protein [Blastocatellia bacterium]
SAIRLGSGLKHILLLVSLRISSRSFNIAFFDGCMFKYFRLPPYRSRSYRNVYPRKSILSHAEADGRSEFNLWVAASARIKLKFEP